MRVTSTDVPRRPIGLRGWLIGAAVVLVILFLSSRGLARFYTDFLWFKEVGFTNTWRRLLSAKFVPALIFSTFFFVVMLTNLIVADRLAPRYRSAAGPEDEIIERYRTYVAPYSGRLRVLVSLFFALVMGGGVSAEWRNWILFSNAVKVPGPGDPQFHKNLGFYMFRLPFIQFAVGWTFAALLVVLIVTAVFHYLNGGIRLQSPWQRVTPQVKVHLSVILALMALTKTAQYYFARFELVFSRRGFVDGASYTDIKAQLPALNLLMIISICAAGLFIANIFRKGWVFPIIAVGLWGFISLVVGTIYPAVVQRVSVQPNEFSKEEPYIERNIAATRAAFGLDAVTTEDFDYAAELEPADATQYSETLANARVWGPEEVANVLRATQPEETYYTFSDVDVDRYISGDEEPPALIAQRELDTGNIPDKTWTNRHLGYTAGCAAVVAYGNEENQSAPNYLLSDIPPKGQLAGQLDAQHSRVYFGEGSSGYVVVRTKLTEQQCIETGSEKVKDYEGSAGVSTSSFLRRTALALRFSDWNLMVSGQLTGDSRVMYLRDVRERVRTAAPFLRFDHDPYPVVANGRLTWIIDAYTTSSHYPYSQALHPSHLPPGSGLDTEFNYVRNSVKATVDAYDGTIHFYVIDKTDPIIKVYERAFPELFEQADDMPEELRSHWRYPEDLFYAQTEQYSLYHMTDPDDFFRKRFLWDISPTSEKELTPGDPTTGATSGSANDSNTGNDGGRNNTLAANANPSPPLYLSMQLPPTGENAESPDPPPNEFVLQRAFTPRNKTNQLSAFMFARTDGENYGKLVSYELPQSSDAKSPFQASSSVVRTFPTISREITLLNQQGSTVEIGPMQLLPIANGIIYLQPIYVKGQSSSIPRLRYVAVAYGDRAALVDFETSGSNPNRWPTVEEGVHALIVGAEGTENSDTADDEVDGETPTTSETTPTSTGPTTPTTAPSGDVTSLLAAAAGELAAADQALVAGDLGAYQSHVTKARAYIDQANALSSSSTTAPPASTSTTAAPVDT